MTVIFTGGPMPRRTLLSLSLLAARDIASELARPDLGSTAPATLAAPRPAPQAQPRVADAAPLYHRCRAAVLSTHYEGLPLVLIDYMSAGCAAIGSQAPGVPDIIQPGVTGWLFPPGDDAALAETLRQVLAGGPAVEAVVARGQSEVPARFSVGQMINRYETLFTELLNSAPSFS